MKRSVCWIFLLVLTLSVNHVQISKACTCSMHHPQTLFCQSDFVALIKVKDFKEVDHMKSQYTVEVRRAFKSNPRISKILRTGVLWTPAQDSVCGRTNMEPGEIWVIGISMKGSSPTITLCDLAMNWTNMKREQRQSFKKYYRGECKHCEILYTSWRYKAAALNSTGGRSCLWESAPGPTECQEEYGICMAGIDGCSWQPSNAYKKCITKHQMKQKKKSRTPKRPDSMAMY